jgi:hypothetical protein
MREITRRVGQLVLLTTFGAALHGQAAKSPTAYSITEVNSIFGVGLTSKIYRNGSRALVDRSAPADPLGSKPLHERLLYDLQTQQVLIWDSVDTSVPCVAGNINGDWGDPFAGSAQISADRDLQNAKQVDTATILGFTAKVFEADMPIAKAKFWIETESGLLLKLQWTPLNGATRTVIEVTEASLSAPPASIFTPAPGCAGVTVSPGGPTEALRIFAETGSNPQDFVKATTGPGSSNSCTMLLRVARAGTLAPVTSGFEVALDLTVDLDHPANYTTGVSTTGHSTFSGGALHAVTDQLRNGVLLVENIPQQFDLEIVFGKGGSSSALIYRHCAGPQTVLLYVVKNPDKLSDGGDWLWVKSGKYAAVTP